MSEGRTGDAAPNSAARLEAPPGSQKPDRQQILPPTCGSHELRPLGAKTRTSGRQTLKHPPLNLMGKGRPVCREGLGGIEISSVVPELLLAARAREIPTLPTAMSPLSRLKHGRF